MTHEDPPPPPMSEAMLDDEALDALFRDIGSLTQIDEVIVKHGPGMVGDAEPPTLEEARAMLDARTIRGVQIRYRHEGAHWWDTLMVTPSGVKLLRVRHDFG